MEVVDKHLGNSLFNDIYKRDMKGLVCDFYKLSNAVIASFNVCDSQTLNRLHSVFCSSLHGIELFSFNHKHISAHSISRTSNFELIHHPASL